VRPSFFRNHFHDKAFEIIILGVLQRILQFERSAVASAFFFRNLSVIFELPEVLLPSHATGNGEKCSGI
jgi:hypothetical protein